jgi:hypothetical protein
MALHTFGTNATTSLSAIQFNPSNGVLSDSDLAALNALIKPNYNNTSGDFQGPNSGKLGTYINREGQMSIPGRGFLQLQPGDWVCTDATTGFPFVLSSIAVSSGPYTHS